MAQNNELTSYLAWKVLVAPTPAWIPTYVPWTNDDAVMAYIEANATFTRLWWVQGLELVEDYAAQEASIRWDECDYVESRFAKPTITANFDWLENINPDWITVINWISIQNVAGTPVVWEVQTKTSGSWNYNNPFLIENQNGDGSLITPTTVVAATDGLLVANTDYFVWLNADWKTVITIIDSATLTTEAQDITITYNYTPNQAKNIWLIRTTIALPELVVKILGCPNSDTEFNTHYLVNASISGTITKWFVDLAEAGEPVASPISFVTNTWGYEVSNIVRWIS